MQIKSVTEFNNGKIFTKPYIINWLNLNVLFIVLLIFIILLYCLNNNKICTVVLSNITSLVTWISQLATKKLKPSNISIAKKCGSRLIHVFLEKETTNANVIKPSIIHYNKKTCVYVDTFLHANMKFEYSYIREFLVID